MRAGAKGSGGIPAVLALAALAAAGCVRAPADSAQAVMARELSGKTCRIWDDPQGIPHARAGDLLALMACFGYVHGRDRAWEMDYFRRVVQGRKAEILGSSQLRSDFVLRLLGLAERAERLYETLPQERKDELLAYAHGANLGFQEALRAGSYEFTELGYRPEPWRPQDSLALVLLQSFDQTRETFERQIDERAWADSAGDARQAESAASPFGLPWETSILKEGEYPKRVRAAARDVSAPPPSAPALPALRQALADLDLGASLGRGSNNWVIAPARSRSRKAWLANDPHLGLRHPPFWHWIHVELAGKTPGEEPALDAIGASLPGLPAIVSGANRHVAWGLTNSYLPVAHLTAVPVRELEAQAQRERPLIWVRWWKLRLPFFFKSFRRTREGWPVLPLPAPEGRALVLRWSGYEIGGRDLASLGGVMRARSAGEMDRALSEVGVPSWNFVFADDAGKIGYRAVGRVPGYAESVPFGIPEQSLTELAADRAFGAPLSPSEMPHLFAPARGFIATANNRQWPRDSRFDAGRAQRESFRAFRIEERLRARPAHDLESLRRIQCDVQAVDARFLLPRLIAALKKHAEAYGALGPGERQALDALERWDFEASLECEACGLYRRWISRMLGDEPNEAALYRKLGATSPSDAILGGVRGSFRGALEDLGLKPAERAARLPRWGELHASGFDHLAGAAFFAAAPLATPGDNESVNPGSSEFSGGRFHHDTGASERLLVELSSPPAVYSVLAGSNADVAGRDLNAPEGAWQDWARCRLKRRQFPLDWSKVASRRLEF